jgi:putative intracellular protease/amidase
VKVLIVVTGASELRLLDGTAHPSGFWAEEFVVPYERFIEAGLTVDVATVGGVRPTPDAGSLNPLLLGYTRPQGSEDNDERNAAHYREVIESLPALSQPLSIESITADQLASYDGVYLSGGHGAMEDLPRSWELAHLLGQVIERRVPLAAVCHGQSALLPLRDSHGNWPFDGYRLTSFSHEEELVTEMAGRLPFVLQFELERLQGRYERAEAIWGSHVVVDHNLITGQNPYSSAELADVFINALRTSASSAGLAKQVS